MKSDKVDIAVIIINFNSSDHTIKCVRSIQEKTKNHLAYEIIIVDNNSESSDFEKLQNLLTVPRLRLVRSRINLGFGGGMMYGAQLSQPKYYFFLNNDCIFLNDCLAQLYQFCERTEDVGICTPQMYDEATQPVPSFDFFPTISSKIFGKAVHYFSNRTLFSDRRIVPSAPIKVDVPSGSQLFIPSRVFNTIGGFDTNLFLYCEEEDLAFRVKALDLSRYVVPSAKNIHVGGASTKRSLQIEKEFYISFFYLYRKHYGRLKTELLWVYTILRCLRKAIQSKLCWSIVWFVVSRPGPHQSMRHKQSISD